MQNDEKYKDTTLQVADVIQKDARLVGVMNVDDALPVVAEICDKHQPGLHAVVKKSLAARVVFANICRANMADHKDVAVRLLSEHSAKLSTAIDAMAQLLVGDMLTDEGKKVATSALHMVWQHQLGATQVFAQEAERKAQEAIEPEPETDPEPEKEATVFDEMNAELKKALSFEDVEGQDFDEAMAVAGGA